MEREKVPQRPRYIAPGYPCPLRDPHLFETAAGLLTRLCALRRRLAAG